jgi:hypothetical protein
MALAAVIFAKIGQISFYLPLGQPNFVLGADPPATLARSTCRRGAEHHTRDGRAPRIPTFHALFCNDF